MSTMGPPATVQWLWSYPLAPSERTHHIDLSESYLPDGIRGGCRSPHRQLSSADYDGCRSTNCCQIWQVLFEDAVDIFMNLWGIW